MKYIINLSLLVIIFFVSSCSKESTPNAIKTGFSAGLGTYLGSSSFGNVNYNESKILTLKIYNEGANSIPGNVQLDNNNFVILSQNGCSLIQVAESCFVKLLFDAKGKTEVIYNAVLNVADLSINISANIIPKVSINNVVFESAGAQVSNVNFGNVGSNQNIIKSISITNKGNSNVVDSINLGNSYSIAFDNCSNKSLSPNKSCSVKVLMSGKGKSGVIQETLSFAGQSINLSANITNPVYGQGSSNIVFIQNNNIVNNLNLGLFDLTTTKQFILNLKNIGTVHSEAAPLNLNNSNLSISFDSCSNKVIQPSSSCQVRFNFTSNNKNPNEYQNSLSLGLKELATTSKVVDNCSELSFVELTSIGFNSTGANVLGKYPNCSISCISSLQQLGIDNKFCEDKDVTGAISFLNDYSNSVSGNSLNISSLNGQQIQFYTDSNCTILNGSALEISTTTNMNLSAGDGIKNVYAKIINGTKSSSCLSDSIILDTQAEYSLTSTGVINRVSSHNLLLNGACENDGTLLKYSFLNAGNIELSSSNISCSSTYSVNPIVPTNAHKVKIEAVDRAGNNYSEEKSLVIYGAISLDPSSVNIEADPGYTKNSTLKLNLSTVESATDFKFSLENTCLDSYSLLTNNPSRLLNLNTNNQIYVKLKNGSTESSCFLVGSIIHDSIQPTVAALSYENKEYGEEGYSPYLLIPTITEVNLKNAKLSLSSDNISNDLVDWLTIALPNSAQRITATMQDKIIYYLRFKAIDRAGNESAISSKSFKHYSLYPYIALKDDGSGNKILDNGTTKTYYLYDFAKLASVSAVKEDFSGVVNLKHNNTIVSTELVSYEAGTYSATNYCNSTPDIMCMVRMTGNVTLNGLHIPQVRKKGFVIYVDGNLTINSGATISMSGRGANAAGQQVFIHPLASISSNGGTGGSRFTAGAGQSGTTAVYYGNNGTSSTEGAGGGGGSGNAARQTTSYTSTGGAGSAGNSWTGGSGGGGAGARTGSASAGDAQINGGQGGNGASTPDWVGFGGTGNPGGTGSGTGNVGTGGTLIIFVKGNIINNGSIEAKGISGVVGGGPSGGGSLTIIHQGTYSGSGTTNVDGGSASLGNGQAWSGTGGAGSFRRINTPSNSVMQSCNAIKTAYPNSLNGKYIIDIDGLDSLEPFEVICDMTTDGGGWTNVTPIMGSYSNVMYGTEIISNAGAGHGTSSPSLPRMGLTSTTTADNYVNGALASYTRPNTTCDARYPVLKLTGQFVGMIGALRVKMEARSYASGGSAACGGILYSDNLTTINPIGFNARTLSTCSNNPGERFYEFTNSQYYTYSYDLTSGDPTVAAIYANCGGSTTHYIQIKSIMVK